MSNRIQPQSDQVTLRPHQQDLVNRVVEAVPPARFLLSSPVGAGKTAALAAAAGAMSARRGRLRCLTVTPAPLAHTWQDQLRRFGGLDALVMTPQAYRRIQAETGGNVNVWSTVPCVVASIDFLKAADRINDALSAGWDFVILDEVHSCTRSTMRGDVAMDVWRATSIGVAAAATAVPDLPEWLCADANTKRIHWNHASLGERNEPQRRIHTIHYSLSPAERVIAARAAELVGGMVTEKSAQLTPQILLRRLASSLYAFEQTLRRLLAADALAELGGDDQCLVDPGDNDEIAVGQPPALDGPLAEQMLSLLENERTDSKWNCCMELLRTCGIGQTDSAVVFTEYADTADYLGYLARSRDITAFVLTGACALEQREQAIRQARSQPSLLIATGAIEGVDIAYTNKIIHYDIPRSPQALQQRIGHVERVTSRYEWFDHYYLLEQDGAMNETLARLIEKVRTIEEQWE